jgi:threonine/homoserine/homoserine lactone efflux protein
MIEAFLSGILLGLTMAIMIGPALFSLLQTSIHRGFRAGMYMALGIFISDVLLVALSYLGVSAFLTEKNNSFVFGLVGGIVIILFGLFTFRKRQAVKPDLENESPLPLETVKPLKYMAKGFALNILNPFLLIFWVGWMAYVGNTFGTYSPETVVFFAGCLSTVLATDMLKCFIAGKIKQYLRPRVVTILNYILGVVLILLGIYMILRVTYAKTPDLSGKETINKEIPLGH